MRLKNVYLIVALCLCTFPASGETVEDAVRNYFEVMNSGAYKESAALFDPDELRGFRDSFTFMTELPAASQVKIYSGFFGPDATHETVSRMSDAEFFGAIWALAMSQMEAKGGMEFVSLEYLGHVMEGDKVAHAVTRLTAQMQDAEIRKLSVASFIKHGEDWKMKMSGDVRTISDQIRTAVGL